MELEELQAAWVQMSHELEKQKELTNEIIMEMTKEKYKSKFSKLLSFETLGALVCYIIAIVVLFNFRKLDTWYLQVCGIITLAFLTVLPSLVLMSLKRIQNLNILKGSYRENILKYTKEKNELMRLQKIGIVFSFLVMPIVVPVTSKIISGKDVFQQTIQPMQCIALIVAFAFMILITRWGLRNYKKITNSAEQLIKDLE